MFLVFFGIFLFTFIQVLCYNSNQLYSLIKIAESMQIAKFDCVRICKDHIIVKVDICGENLTVRTLTVANCC